jgi:hypothetical protein
MNEETSSDPTAPTRMNDWLKLIIASPLAAALTTALIGALLTNYVVDAFKNKTAAAERKLQRQADLAARQFETIQKLIEFESDYFVSAEFAFFNLIERRRDIDQASLGNIAADYDVAAKSFITNGYKAAFAAQVYLKGTATGSGTTEGLASAPRDVIPIEVIFSEIVKTEGDIARYVCKHGKDPADLPDDVLAEGRKLRDELRDQHARFVDHLSKLGASIYHPPGP